MIVVAVAVGSGRRLQWHPRRAGHGDAERQRRESLYERALGRHSVWIAWAAGAIYSLPGWMTDHRRILIVIMSGAVGIYLADALLIVANSEPGARRG
jgi:hypothetical protein